MTKRTGSIRRKGTGTRKNRRIALLVLAFAACLPAGGQDRDAGLWTGLELEKGLNGWLGLKGSVEHRRDRNLVRMDRSFVEAGLKADAGKYMEASLSYRYTRRSLPEYGTAGIHRLYADLTFEYDWGELTAAQRLRLTMDKNPAFLADEFIEEKARLKTSLQYNIRKTPLKVGTSAEYFFPSPAGEMLLADKSRYTLGLDCSLTRNISLGVSHHYERERFRNRPVVHFIWVVRMKYVL